MTNSCNIPEDHAELTQYGRRETRSIILQDWYQVELAQNYERDTRPSLYNITREKYQAELPKYPRRGLPDLIAINFSRTKIVLQRFISKDLMPWKVWVDLFGCRHIYILYYVLPPSSVSPLQIMCIYYWQVL